MEPYVERSLVSGGLLVPSLYTSHIVYVFLKVYDFDCSNSILPPRGGLQMSWRDWGSFWGNGRRGGGGGVGVGDGGGEVGWME